MSASVAILFARRDSISLDRLRELFAHDPLLPPSHPLRNTPLHLIRASYQWINTNRPNDWHRVTKSFTIAKSTYNELAASWTEAYRWRVEDDRTGI